MIAGRLDHYATFPISPEGRLAVKCWQAMLCLDQYQENRFTRTPESFSSATPVMPRCQERALSSTRGPTVSR